MGMYRRPAETRFWEKVRKSRGCWNWNAGKLCAGYGKFRLWVNGVKKTVLAHRYSWELHFGNIPSGLKVLHRCDNPSCVKPEHLFIGTQKDNVQDMISKGRKGRNTPPAQKGEKHYCAKFSNEDIAKIRELAELGHKQTDIAKLFNTSRMTINSIVKRRRWKHI